MADIIQKREKEKEEDIFGNDAMDLCEEGNFYIQSTSFKLVLSIHIICSLLAICTNFWFLRYGFQRVYFHRNVRVIMAFSLVSNVIHSLFCIILQGTHLYLYLTSSSGCQVVVPVQLCLFLRQPMNITMMSFVPFNVAIVLERGVATIRVHSYEKCSSYFGYHLSVLAVLSSLLIIYWSQHLTPISGDELYCSAVNKFTQDGVTLSSYLAIALEIGAILCFFVIWLVNARRRNRLIFDVTTAYQVAENLASLTLLLPWMVFHLLMFVFFNAANFTVPLMGDFVQNKMTIRSAYAAVYIIPLYCMLSPFLLNLIVKSQKKNRVKQLQRLSATVADTGSYETYLHKQWY